MGNRPIDTSSFPTRAGCHLVPLPASGRVELGTGRESVGQVVLEVKAGRGSFGERSKRIGALSDRSLVMEVATCIHEDRGAKGLNVLFGEVARRTKRPRFRDGL